MQLQNVLAAAFLAVAALTAGALGDPSPAAAGDRPSLRVGISASGPPMAFFERGVLRGLEVDLARALADDLGRELQVKEMPAPRLIDALRGGRVDLTLSALPDSDLEALGLRAVSGLLETGQMALIRIDEASRYSRPIDLMTTSARVAYQWGTAGARFVQAHFPNAERMPYPDAQTAISALRAGHVDVVVHDATTAWAIAADAREDAIMGVFSPLAVERLAWVARNEDVLLQQSIDTVVSDWRRSGRVQEIINRWIRIRVQVSE